MSIFYLENLKEKTLEEAIAFIEPMEESSVALMSRLIDGKWKDSVYSYYLVYEGDPIFKKNLVAVIMHSEGGLLQFCIKDAAKYEKSSGFARCLKPIFEDSTLYCIMGEMKGANLLKKIAEKYAPEKSLMEERDYLLLLYHPENLPDELLEEKFDFEAVQLTLDDKDEVFDIQKKYDTVEVQPKGREFNPQLCKYNIVSMLKKQIVYAVKDGDRIVAKAGSNAIGKNYIQLGGVYTEEEYRGKGMARFLVSSLAKKVVSMGKMCALFVRVENTSAKAAYRKAGFTYQSDYKIIYFNEE